MKNTKDYAPTTIRITIGLLFLIAGLSKLFNPSGIIGMLTGLGFPISSVLGWILILSEVSAGSALIVGWKTKVAVWPPLVILAVAIITVHLGSLGENPMAPINIMFHVLGIATLVSLYLSGPGNLAVTRE